MVSVPARADPWKTLHWTNPLFNAALDDSGNPYCDVGRDTCRDLSRIVIWGQSNAGGSARIVKEISVLGRAGLDDSAQIDLQAAYLHWHFWAFAMDLAGHSSPCPSPVLYVAGSQVTGVDPSELVVADPLWFDVQGRKVLDPRGTRWTGIRFLVWRVRGQVQKPAAKVYFDRGEIRGRLPLPRWSVP